MFKVDDWTAQPQPLDPGDAASALHIQCGTEESLRAVYGSHNSSPLASAAICFNVCFTLIVVALITSFTVCRWIASLERRHALEIGESHAQSRPDQASSTVAPVDNQDPGLPA